MFDINVKFPLEDDKSKNRYFKLTSLTKDALTSNLLLLLLTNKGERYYNPDFGTNLLRFIFEPKDDVTQSDIEEDVKSTVKKFIPELTINRLTFSNVDDFGNKIDDNQLNIIIGFTYKDNTFSENGQLEINI